MTLFRSSTNSLGKRLELGEDEDSNVGVKSVDVLKFNTSKPGDKQNNFTDYIDQMKEEQNDISYITGESIAIVSSLFEENLREKGHEEPYVAEPADEHAVYQFKESNGTKLNLGEDMAVVSSFSVRAKFAQERS